MRANTYAKSPTMARIVTLLKSGMLLTKHTASDRAHCDKRTAERMLSHLWLERMVHIASWEKVYNNTTARYRWGNGVDIPRPAPVSPAEKQKKYRSKPEVRERQSAAKRWRNSVGKEVRIGIWGL